jgi:predicted DNA-binding transcriptional regulator AlpA
MTRAYSPQQIPSNPPQALLRESEVSREFGFGRPWLRKRRRLNLPPAFIRIDRSVFYSRSDLDGFISQHRVNPAGGSEENQ